MFPDSSKENRPFVQIMKDINNHIPKAESELERGERGEEEQFRETYYNLPRIFWEDLGCWGKTPAALSQYHEAEGWKFQGGWPLNCGWKFKGYLASKGG